MKNFFIALLFFAAHFLLPSAYAVQDEAEIREIVRDEIKRALAGDGADDGMNAAMDTAIERGIQRLIERQQAEAARQQVADQQDAGQNLRAVDAQRDHIFGNPDAEVTLVEYSDFECPFCKRFHPTAIQLLAQNAGNLRWVYRHFPLGIHNPGAQKQAEASECVAALAGNDAFWDFIHAIYDRTSAGGNGFPLANLRPLAEELSVDGDAFAQCLNGGRMAARVREDYDDGAALGITGTPAGVLINRRGDVRFVVGALPLNELQGMVDELLR